METLSIGVIAKRAGIASSTIRYYERIGLLPAPGRSVIRLPSFSWR